MKEIDLKLETVEVKGKSTPLPTIREMNRGVWGKIRSYFYWLFHKDNQTYKEYLDTRVTYVVGEPIIYYNADIDWDKFDEILENAWDKAESKRDKRYVVYPDPAPLDKKTLFDAVKKHILRYNKTNIRK